MQVSLLTAVVLLIEARAHAGTCDLKTGPYPNFLSQMYCADVHIDKAQISVRSRLDLLGTGTISTSAYRPV